MRRQFKMPEGDVAALDGAGLEWETVMEGQVFWLVLPRFKVPAGYNHAIVGTALRIPPSYPDNQIDMVYFHPHLSLASGRPIGALTQLVIDGKTYQQWSRHRTPANPWRPEIDNVGTHLLLVNDWLTKERG
jgi:hypothetical protein